LRKIGQTRTTQSLNLPNVILQHPATADLFRLLKRIKNCKFLNSCCNFSVFIPKRFSAAIMLSINRNTKN